MISKYLRCVLLLFTIGVCSLSAAAQAPTPVRFVDVMPEFTGSLSEFLIGNLRYPDSAREASIEGRAVVEFTVQTTGLVSQIHIKQLSASPKRVQFRSIVS